MASDTGKETPSTPTAASEKPPWWLVPSTTIEKLVSNSLYALTFRAASRPKLYLFGPLAIFSLALAGFLRLRLELEFTKFMIPQDSRQITEFEAYRDTWGREAASAAVVWGDGTDPDGNALTAARLVEVHGAFLAASRAVGSNGETHASVCQKIGPAGRCNVLSPLLYFECVSDPCVEVLSEALADNIRALGDAGVLARLNDPAAVDGLGRPLALLRRAMVGGVTPAAALSDPSVPITAATHVLNVLTNEWTVKDPDDEGADPAGVTEDQVECFESAFLDAWPEQNVEDSAMLASRAEQDGIVKTSTGNFDFVAASMIVMVVFVIAALSRGLPFGRSRIALALLGVNLVSASVMFAYGITVGAGWAITPAAQLTFFVLLSIGADGYFAFTAEFDRRKTAFIVANSGSPLGTPPPVARMGSGKKVAPAPNSGRDSTPDASNSSSSTDAGTSASSGFVSSSSASSSSASSSSQSSSQSSSPESSPESASPESASPESASPESASPVSQMQGCPPELLEAQIPTLIAESMHSVGASLLYTAITSFIAFMSTGTTDFPVLRYFSVTTGAAVMINIFLTMTCFVAGVALDEKRKLRNRRDCLCCTTAPRSIVDEEAEVALSTQSAPLIERFFGAYGRTFSSGKQAIAIIFVAAVAFGFAMWGTINTRVTFDTSDFLPNGSVTKDFIDERASGFENEIGTPMVFHVVADDFKSPETQAALDGLFQVTQTSEWYRADQSFSVFRFMLDNARTAGIVGADEYIPAAAFNSLLNTTLSLPGFGPIFSIDVTRDASGEVVRARIRAEHVPIPTLGQDSVRAMDTAIEACDAAIAAGTLTQCIAFADTAYPFALMVRIVKRELFPQVATAWGLVTIFLLLTNHPAAAVIMSTLLGVTIINLLGIIRLVGLAIDPTSMSGVIIASGLAIDHCLHTTHVYFSTPGPRSRRVLVALRNMGGSVLQAGTSTALGTAVLLFARANGFLFFAGVFILTDVMGLISGLIILPAVLRLFGPQGDLLRSHAHAGSHK